MPRQSTYAVRIQIYVAIYAYCLVSIVQHDMKLERNTYAILKILGITHFFFRDRESSFNFFSIFICDLTSRRCSYFGEISSGFRFPCRWDSAPSLHHPLLPILNIHTFGQSVNICSLSHTSSVAGIDHPIFYGSLIFCRLNTKFFFQEGIPVPLVN